MNADVRYRYVQPVNAKAWAIGRKLKNGRFHIRRIVWGRMLARMEKWTGEHITPVRILVRQQEPCSANEKRAIKYQQTQTRERANGKSKPMVLASRNRDEDRHLLAGQKMCSNPK